MLLHGIIANGKEQYSETIDILSERAFEVFENKILYGACKTLFENNQDINITAVLSTAISMGLAKDNLDEVFAVPAPKLTEARSLASKLKSRLVIKESVGLHRTAIDKLSQMSATENINQIFSVSEAALFDLIAKFSSSQDDIIKLGNVARDIVNFWGDNPSENIGLPTPWPKFNKSIGGGMRTGVTLVGTRSGVGKTFFATITANYLTNLDVPVLILDTEMEYKDILPRILANTSEVSINKIESGLFNQSDFDKKAIEGALTQLAKSPFYYKSIAGKSFDEIMSIVRRWIYTTVGINKEGRANQCLVIYDYFKIMDSGDIGDMAEFQAMGFQISKLTDFCKAYDFPCLSFVQLNRDGVAKEGTDVIAQSDRLLWLCNSFSLLKVKTKEEMELHGWNNGNRKLITLKSRYGGEMAPGEFISMQFNGEFASLKEVVEKDNSGPPNEE
jgi:replicative DNA helicase